MIKLGIACAIAVSAINVAYASDGEIALAREFWSLDSLARGYAEPSEEQLSQAAPNLVAYCARTPIGKMPMPLMRTCEEFEAFKAWHEQSILRELESR